MENPDKPSATYFWQQAYEYERLLGFANTHGGVDMESAEHLMQARDDYVHLARQQDSDFAVRALQRELLIEQARQIADRADEVIISARAFALLTANMLAKSRRR